MSDSKEYSPKEINALTSLRFIAALYVFLFHVQIRWPIIKDGFFANILNQGAIGMSIFFMLSGFILAYRYGNNDDFSKENYIRARVARIYPIYIVAFITSMPALYFQIDENLRFGALSIIIQVTIIIITSILMIQAWIPMLFSYANNSASWSLSAEAFFYTVFIFTIKIFMSLNKKNLIYSLFLLYIVSIIPVVSYYAFENRPTHGLQIFYAMPIFRLSEFFIGIIGFYFSKKVQQGTVLNFITIALILILFVYIGFFGHILPIFVGHNWIVIPTILLILVILSDNDNRASMFLSGNVAMWLGRISYCFYSFQFHVLFFVGGLLYLFELSNVQCLIISMVLLIMISALAYYKIEEPARRLLLRRDVSLQGLVLRPVSGK